MRMKTGLLQSIIKKVIVILPFYLFTFLPLTAQTFTQRIQKTTAGEGTITIHQDQRRRHLHPSNLSQRQKTHLSRKSKTRQSVIVSKRQRPTAHRLPQSVYSRL